MNKDNLRIGSYEFESRFFLGTGKYPTPEIAKQAVEISGAEVLTFALRRVNFDNPQESLLNYISISDFTLLPNTAGANTAEDAVRLARMAKEAGLCDLIKVEVIGDEKTLLPDPIETLKATEILAKEGFICLPYCSDDLVLAKRLVAAGAAAVMPGGAPIGSGQGIVNTLNLKLIIEAVNVPVIVDAGLAVPSDAAKAMELGASGVLMNSAIAYASDPVLMAEAMKEGISAGRKAFLAGRIPRKLYAKASSPEEGMPV